MKKLTFLEAQAAAQVAKNNSDLANLANAMEVIRLHEQDLMALREEIVTTAARIEGGELVPVEQVHRLYERAHGRDNMGKRL